MVRKVVTPAMNSVRMSVPCALSLKYRAAMAAACVATTYAWLFDAGALARFARLAIRSLLCPRPRKPIAHSNCALARLCELWIRSGRRRRAQHGPTNPDQRQQTLHRAREHARHFRHQRGELRL